MASEIEPMKHRIRTAAIVVEGDSVLLVKHQGHGPEDGYVWWVPPGGGVSPHDLHGGYGRNVSPI